MMLEIPFVIGAFIAGVLMFLAPCTLPLVPAYLAFIAGGAGKDRPTVVRNAFAFVLGFSLVFIALGLFAGSLGALVGPWRGLLGQVGGAVVVFFGLTMLGVVRIPAAMRERHIAIPSFLIVGRAESSFLVGALFALGWSPCIGPILGTILLIASTSPSALTGALLLAVFSLGLAVPFMLTAYLLASASLFLPRLGRVAAWLSFIGGVVLVLLGLFMLTKNMGLFVAWGYALFEFVGYERLLNYL